MASETVPLCGSRELLPIPFMGRRASALTPEKCVTAFGSEARGTCAGLASILIMTARESSNAAPNNVDCGESERGARERALKDALASIPSAHPEAVGVQGREGREGSTEFTTLKPSLPPKMAPALTSPSRACFPIIVTRGMHAYRRAVAAVKIPLAQLPKTAASLETASLFIFRDHSVTHTSVTAAGSLDTAAANLEAIPAGAVSIAVALARVNGQPAHPNPESWYSCIETANRRPFSDVNT